MPTYEYRCPEGHEFEKFVRNMSDAASTLACPTCGAMAARRMSAGGGLLFKGSGFYITDYGKDGKKDQRTAATADAAKSEGAAKEKSDAVPAAAATKTPASPGTATATPAASASTTPAPSSTPKEKSGKNQEKKK